MTFGNYYHIVNGSDNLGSEWYGQSVSFGISEASAGSMVQLSLYKWLNDTNANGQMEVDERQKVAFASYEVIGDEQWNEWISLDLIPIAPEFGDTTFIHLDSDQGYLVMVEFIAPAQGENLSISVNQAIDYQNQVLRTDPNLFGDFPYRPASILGIGHPDEVVFIPNNYPNTTAAVRLSITQKAPVNVQDLDVANTIALTPNPANDYLDLNVHFVRPQKNISVRIMDQQGKTYAVEKFEDVQEQTLQLDTRKLSTGIYFINIITEEGQRTERVIIQR